MEPSGAPPTAGPPGRPNPTGRHPAALDKVVACNPPPRGWLFARGSAGRLPRLGLKPLAVSTDIRNGRQGGEGGNEGGSSADANQRKARRTKTLFDGASVEVALGST